MSESAGLTLIQTLVKTATGFTGTGTSTNVSIGKWGIRNSGASDHYAIIKPGPTNRPQLSFTKKDNLYRTIVQVWQRYKDDGTTLTNLLGYVDNITTKIDATPKLGDTTATIRDANATGYSDVFEMVNNDGGIDWLRRDIFIDWIEEE